MRILVPILIFLSGAFMATAWLGHLRIRHQPFWIALALSWCIVLPEYLLNVSATRLGFGMYTGAQMAAIHLASGIICVLLVSRFVLGEQLKGTHVVGFALLAAGMTLILKK